MLPTLYAADREYICQSLMPDYKNMILSKSFLQDSSSPSLYLAVSQVKTNEQTNYKVKSYYQIKEVWSASLVGVIYMTSSLR